MDATVQTKPRMRVRVPSSKQSKGQLRRKRMLEFGIFALPWMIGFLVFQLYPLLQSLEISMSNVQFSRAAGLQFSFVGVQNFRDAITVDAHFTSVLMQTVVLTLFQMPLIMAFSLTAAVLMKQGLWGTTFFRALFFLPVVIGSSSVMNQLTVHGGVPIVVMPRFMSAVYSSVGPTLAKYVSAIYQALALMLWRSGVQTLLFLAGLYGVSPTYYEVARIDGASAWQTFLKVTLPVLSPMILLVAIYTLVDSFTDPLLNPVLNYVLGIQTTGGALEYGKASAMEWIYFVVVFVILLLIFRYAREHVYYAGER